MIRPEARALLHEAREALAGLALAGAGLWLVVQPGYVLPALGVVMTAAGTALTVIGARRMRFRARGEGPGVVQVVEGQIGYFGPHDGGVMALDDMAQLWLSGDGQSWLILSADGRRLAIPRAARGAEALFDAFASLEGLDMARLLRLIAVAPDGRDRPIWRRDARVLLT